MGRDAALFRGPSARAGEHSGRGSRAGKRGTTHEANRCHTLRSPGPGGGTGPGSDGSGRLAPRRHGVTALEAPGRTAQEVTLYDLPPLPFDREAYAAYAESPANDGSAIPREYTYGGERVFFPDEAAFTKTTGVPIPHGEDLSLTIFSVMDQEPLVHQVSFDATATLDGRSCRLMGAFATEGIFGYHYGQEMPVYDSFEYAPGHRAYLLEYRNEETDVRLYWFLFAESGIFYRIPLTDGTQVYDPALTPESADMDFYKAVMASLAVE